MKFNDYMHHQYCFAFKWQN